MELEDLLLLSQQEMALGVHSLGNSRGFRARRGLRFRSQSFQFSQRRLRPASLPCLLRRFSSWLAVMGSLAQQGHLRRNKDGEGEGDMGGMARCTVLCREGCPLLLASVQLRPLGLSIP